MGNPLSDIERAWLQLEEVQQDFEMLSNEDLINCRDAVSERIKKAMECLSPHVRDDMSEYEAD